MVSATGGVAFVGRLVLARIVDRPTAIAAAEWSERKLLALADQADQADQAAAQSGATA